MPPEYYATQKTLAEIRLFLEYLHLNLRAENRTWGYMERLALNLNHTMTEDAHYVMIFPAVPANEVWVLQAAAGRDTARALTITVETIAPGDLRCTHQFATSGGAWQWVFFSGEVVLKEGDVVSIFFTSAITNDILQGQVWGYKMKTWI